MPESRIDLMMRQEFLGNQRRQTLGRFVENEQRWVGHERAANGQHLLLAAGKLLAAMRQSFLEPGKSFEHALVSPFAPTVGSGSRRHDQVFLDREIGENGAAFGNVGDALARGQVGSSPRHVLSVDHDFAPPRRHLPDQSANQRGFAHAVSAHQPNGLTCAQGEIDTAQNMTGAKVGVEITCFDDWRFSHNNSASLPRYAACTVRLARISSGAPEARILPSTITISTLAS